MTQLEMLESKLRFAQLHRAEQKKMMKSFKPQKNLENPQPAYKAKIARAAKVDAVRSNSLIFDLTMKQVSQTKSKKVTKRVVAKMLKQIENSNVALQSQSNEEGMTF